MCLDKETVGTGSERSLRQSGHKAARSPEVDPSPPPGCCTLCVASNTTGWPFASRVGNERISTTRLLYPKVVPRSVCQISCAFADSNLRTTCRISPGERKLPLFHIHDPPRRGRRFQ